MEEILSKLYEITAFGGFSYQVALMWVIGSAVAAGVLISFIS